MFKTAQITGAFTMSFSVVQGVNRIKSVKIWNGSENQGVAEVEITIDKRRFGPVSVAAGSGQGSQFMFNENYEPTCVIPVDGPAANYDGLSLARSSPMQTAEDLSRPNSMVSARGISTAGSMATANAYNPPGSGGGG